MKSARWRIKAEELQHHATATGLAQSLPQGLGAGQSSVIRLEADLVCIKTHYAPVRDLAVISSMDQDEPRLVLTLGLQGASRFVSVSGKEVTFNAGFATITSFNASLGERHYQAGGPVTQLRFAVTRRWLAQYFGESPLQSLFSSGDVRTLSYRPISPQSLIAAENLLSQEVTDGLGRMAMHGRALGLLAGELSPLLALESKGSGKGGRREMAMANHARDLLLQEFKNPPSIIQLARLAGTNPFKLKQLFHQFFNNTPYGLLLEYRMNKAYHLLQTTRCAVQEAADATGYRHASNFSAAFTRYFGVSPKAVAKQRNNRR